MATMKEQLSFSENIDLSRSKVGSMELFRLEYEGIKLFFSDRISDCSYGVFKISSCGMSGFATYSLPARSTDRDLVRWASVFMHMKGYSIEEAIRYVHNEGSAWGMIRQQLAERSLYNLVDRMRFPLTLHGKDNFQLDRAFLMNHSQAYFSF